MLGPSGALDTLRCLKTDMAEHTQERAFYSSVIGTGLESSRILSKEKYIRARHSEPSNAVIQENNEPLRTTRRGTAKANLSIDEFKAIRAEI